MRPAGSSKKGARPVLLACTECRLRHLRCDGRLPHCSRCSASNTFCQYLKSRRGGKKKQRSASDSSNINQSSIQVRLSTALGVPTSPGSAGVFGDDTSSRVPHSQSGSSTDADNHHEEHEYEITAVTSRTLNDSMDQAYSDPGSKEPAIVSLYYEHFHRAHPILVSQSLYYKRQYPKYLTAVVNLIGSRLFPPDRAICSYSSLLQTLQSSQENSLCLVQAKLLYSIFLYGQAEMQLAKTMFVSARDLAIQLQLNRREILETYPSALGELEWESIRGTWWELYVADGHMTALWPELGFLTNTVDCNVPMPCDEVSSESQHITRTPVASLFNPDILLTEEDGAGLPSWWFRIKAISLLGKVILSGGRHIDDTAAQTAMNALATWRLSLPQDQMTLMDPYGQVNELMLEAEATVQYATILLHFPRSNLNSGLSLPLPTILSDADTCLPIRSCTKEVHGIKATEASKEISNLFSIYPFMEKCSPLMIPCLSLCSTVQLATCFAHAPIRNCLETHRDRVRLLVGLLASAGRIWNQARNAQKELKSAALETFQLIQTSKAPSEGSQPDATGMAPANFPSPIFQGSWLPMELPNGHQEIGSWPWLTSPPSQA